MAKIKISKEELQHDEVLETADVALHWVREHLKFLIGVLICVLVAYAVVGVWSSKRESTLSGANDDLAAAVDKYQQALSEHAWATPERQAAMKEVVTLAQKIVTEHPGTSLARQALLLEGSAHYAAGDPIASAREGAPNTNEAITTFTRYVAEAPDDEVAQGKLALAGAYENMFFLIGRPDNPTTFQDDARRTYQEVVDDKNAPEFVRTEALLALGRLSAFQGRTAEAEKYYRQVMEMRYKPLKKPADERQLSRQLIFELQQREETFSYAGTARLELQRLGVDVDKEYPLVEETKEAAAVPAAK